MNMRGFWLGLAVGTISTCLLGQWVFTAASKETDPPKGISPEIVADYIHSVVQADRTFYTTEIVERMQTRGIVFASEHWREDGALPLPAQFLFESGRLVAKQPHGIRFRLISSWAINKRNSPTTEFERTALTKILVNTDRSYAGVTTQGRARVFQALYPDKAPVFEVRRLLQCASRKPKEGLQDGRRDGWDSSNDSTPPIGKANERPSS